MRITPTRVRAIADELHELSDGVMGSVQVGGDIGHGTRYIDGRRMLVWLGRYGSTHAAAYYLGAYEAYRRSALTSGGPCEFAPALASIKAEILDRPGFWTWHGRGLADAAALMRRNGGE